MTMERNEKKKISWATRGEQTKVDNPVEIGRRRAAGQSDYYTGPEYIASVRSFKNTPSDEIRTANRATKLASLRRGRA